MKRSILLNIFLATLLVAQGYATRPQAVLGPGPGGANFRVPYHQTFNKTLSSDTTYILTGWYFVDSTFSITIPAGTLIRGDSASGGALIIKRGARISAIGTVSQPVIFTSNKPAGTRVPGDWGGVILLGQAPTNQATTQQIEGGFGTIPNSDAMYGGADPNDNSGTLEYVRIEFAGIAFAQDNEINGLTFGGVGAGTTIDHIQVSFANDDDYEFFGGTVQAKYLVGWRSLDDCFDTDFGFSGKLQFMYTKRDPNIFDASASGSSNGEESDNEGTAPFDHFPRTKARFSNWTLVGPLSDTANLPSLNSHWGYVALLRRATQLSIYNSVMMGWGRGINLRDTLTQRAAIDGSMELRNISLQSPREIVVASSSPATGNIPGFDPVAWFTTSGWGNLGSTPRQTSDIGMSANVWNLDNTNNPVPPAGSEPATAGTAYDGRLLGDAWFTQVSYRGAFDPSLPQSQQWTAGWTNFDPQNYDPEAVYSVSVPVLSDWNMISNPVANPVPDDSAKHLYPTLLSQVFRFDNGYLAGNVMENGVGYWGKFPAAVAQPIIGTPLTTDSISVAAGWNMVGSISNPVDTATIAQVPGGLKGSAWYGFNAGYVPTSSLVPGKAYWIKANVAGKFVLANPLAGSPAGKEQGTKAGLDRLNTLTLADSRGGAQTLYFGIDAKKEIPAAEYAMPPLPPAGAFDARFETVDGGSMVLIHDGKPGSEMTVLVRSDAYPVTISWSVGHEQYILADGRGGKLFPPRTISGEGSMRVMSSEANRITLTATGAAELPAAFALSQNYPNPFNPSTTIKYALPVDSRVSMSIYNVLGQNVRTLVDDNVAAGYHVAEWNGTGNGGRPLSSGTYFVRLSAQGSNGKSFTEVHKLLLLK